jgi:hypothetical protein
MTTLRLTYIELAERTQLTREGARMLARRRRWRIERGNDGKARVIVREADLVIEPPRPPPDDQPQPPHDPPPDSKIILELLDRIRVLEAERTELAAQAAYAEGEARALRDALEDLARRLDLATAPWWRRWLG